MLFNTFAHISGIGAATEQRLWAAGVCSWDDFVQPWPQDFSGRRGEMVARHLAESRQSFDAGAIAVGRLLRNNLLWRLYPHFRDTIAYLDIETTGLDKDTDLITSIALYGGGSVFTYVRGENLDDFIKAISRYQVLVTYNGRGFDVPVLERTFAIKIDHAHIDLRFLLQELGITGGLKGCEKKLGIVRDDGLDGVDGRFAVFLWREYERTGNRAFLETLLAYNVADTVNLEALMVHAYNRKVAQTPFAESLLLPMPEPPVNPFVADTSLVHDLRQRYSL
ncbi:MAG: ribonuclease H-like domain-containing protein [Desulfobulbaceae bacterium]|nr:ribonuclease H-like domain-containing protein [Desulfobulbaceae bacterium]